MSRCLETGFGQTVSTDHSDILPYHHLFSEYYHSHCDHANTSAVLSLVLSPWNHSVHQVITE
jgi:hypothetical protein